MSPRQARGPAVAFLAIALLTGAVLPDPDLMDAAQRGDVAAVRSLLRGGADPNEARGDGLTTLHVAAQGGHLEIAKLLIDSGAKVDVGTRLGGYTPLHLASEGGHAGVVEALIDSGGDPEAVTTTSGVTPLHLAAAAVEGEGAVRVLLERGAPVSSTEAQAGQTPLMFAASAGRTAAISELLKHGADPGISTEVVDVLRRMAVDRAAISHLQDARKEIRGDTPEGSDPRALTAEEEQAAIATQREFLRSDGEIAKVMEAANLDSLSRRMPLWQTPSGLKSDVEMLRRPQWEVLVGITGGMTALTHSAREGHVEAAMVLLDGGADVDQVAGDGSSALLIATINGQFDLAMKLIERGANPNLATNTDGVSPLFAVLRTQWGAYNTGHPQPRARDLQESEHMDVLNALLAAGADPNVRLKTHLYYFNWFNGQLGLDITGATPFWRATFAQDLEAMKSLVAYGADPHVPTMWPEWGMRGARQQDGRIMDDSGIPRLEGAPNMYPIHAAAGGGYLGIGSWQVVAVPNNFLNALKYLVEEHGVDVNLPDSWGYTPLHYAASRGEGGHDMIEYLVSEGADLTATTFLGQTPADMARGGRAGYFERVAFPKTVEFLQSLGSPLRCMNTIFRGTGDFCEGTQVEAWEGMATDEDGKIRSTNAR